MTKATQSLASVAYYSLTEPQLNNLITLSVKKTLQEIGFPFDDTKERLSIDPKQERRPVTYWLNKYHVNRTTLWRWQKDGLITPTRMGKKIFFCQADFDQMFSKKKELEKRK